MPEDRNHMGMVGSFTVAENLVLDSYYSQPYSRRGVLDGQAIRTVAKQRHYRSRLHLPVVVEVLDENSPVSHTSERKRLLLAGVEFL